MSYIHTYIHMSSLVGGSSYLGNIHSDVLSATPSSDEDKNRLVEELKSRAKSSIKARNFPEAITLYSKGIELLSGNAILYANRSMCHLSMSRSEEAVSDAQRAVDLDPTYAKGYYRLGAVCMYVCM